MTAFPEDTLRASQFDLGESLNAAQTLGMLAALFCVIVSSLGQKTGDKTRVWGRW